MRKLTRQALVMWLRSAPNTARYEDAEERMLAIAAILEADQRAMLGAWDAWGGLVSSLGHPDMCDECYVVSGAAYHDLCAVHRDAKLWDAMLVVVDRLGPCECGHAVGDHNDEDDARCRAVDCACLAFRLRREGE